MVSQFFRSGSTFTVNVMNLKHFISTAMLAPVAVALQCFVAVASKVVVVFGSLAILCKPLFVGRKPFVNPAYFSLSLAGIAAFLRAGSVRERNAAIQAVADRAQRGRAILEAQRSQGLNIPLSAVLRFTRFADLLNRSGRLESNGTQGAGLGLVWHSNPLNKCFRIVA
jgi:hypothetical protein